MPRWDAATGTFRPPFFHRNVTSELNGILRHPGAAAGSPFAAGCAYLTPSLTAHGVSGRTVAHERDHSDAEADQPQPPGAMLGFQLETALPMSLTPWAEEARLPAWSATWGSVRSTFTR